MKILSVFVKSFGKLNNFKMDFSDGINFLIEDNGFGKTTLAVFIKSMFFGINYTTKRNIEENEYKRFKPFNSTEKFGGSLRFENEGKIFRIERYFGATLKEQEMKVFDDQTNKLFKVEFGDPSKEIGCRLFGLNAEAFMRSLYFPQDAIVVENNDSFLQKLSNLAENADDDTNAKKAEERLREFCKKIKYEKGEGGVLYTLNKQLEQTQKRKKEEYAIWQRQNYLSQQIVAVTKDLMENARLLDIADKKLTATREKLNNSNKFSTIDTLMSQISQNEQKQAETKSKIDRVNIVTAKQDTTTATPKKLPIWQVVLCVLLALTGIGVCFASVVIGAIVLCVSVALFAVFYSKFVNTAKREKLEAILLESKESQQKEAVLVEYNAQLKALQEAEIDLKARLTEAAPEGVEKAKQIKKQLEEQLLLLNKEFEVQSNQKLMLTTKLTEYKMELGMLSKEQCNPTDTEGEITRITEQILETQQKYTAAKLAWDTLLLSREKLTEAYLPRLNQLFNNYLHIVADKRLGEAAVNSKFDVTVEEQGKQRESAYLSQGYRDVCNFALRLALVECIYGKKLPFVILDDPFVNFDKKNTGKAMEILKQLSQSMQILFLTCHERFKA